MRGKDAAVQSQKRWQRITPAYAGKSPVHQAHCKQGQDHPRLCGEKNSVLGDVREVSGSPPPMRGKVIYDSGKPNVVRITPAYAGKSISCRCTEFFFRDHPRLCGEKSYQMSKFGHTYGSPPPMRGKD